MANKTLRLPLAGCVPACGAAPHVRPSADGPHGAEQSLGSCFTEFRLSVVYALPLRRLGRDALLHGAVRLPWVPGLNPPHSARENCLKRPTTLVYLNFFFF